MLFAWPWPYELATIATRVDRLTSASKSARRTRRCLGHTLHSFSGPRISLDGPEIAALRPYFSERGVALPTNPPEWRRWWAKCDEHRTYAFSRQRDPQIHDTMAISDPKRFYREVTRPFSASHYTALRTPQGTVTSDEGIERCLTSYLENIGAKPDPSVEEKENNPAALCPKWEGKHLRHRKHLSPMMNCIDEHTMMRVLSTVDGTSAPGHDGLSPGLLKAALTATWTEVTTRTPRDDLQDRINLKFNSSFQAMREELNYKEGTAQALRAVRK